MSKRKYKTTKRKACDTKHHIKPRSRGGSSKLENIAFIPNKDHQLYHSLFSNQTPDEIVDTLVTYYWNGQWAYVEKAYRRAHGNKH